MITRTKVSGKDATVAYLNKDWIPCQPSEATLVKIMFDDGGMWFGVPVTPTGK